MLVFRMCARARLPDVRFEGDLATIVASSLLLACAGVTAWHPPLRMGSSGPAPRHRQPATDPTVVGLLRARPRHNSCRNQIRDNSDGFAPRQLGRVRSGSGSHIPQGLKAVVVLSSIPYFVTSLFPLGSLVEICAERVRTRPTPICATFHRALLFSACGSRARAFWQFASL